MLTEIGQLIETHRKKAGMTQTQLVDKICWEQSNYSAMIHGHRPINDEVLNEIVEILDIPESEISEIRDNRNYKRTVILNLRKLSPESIKKLKDYSELLLLSEKK